MVIGADSDTELVVQESLASLDDSEISWESSSVMLRARMPQNHLALNGHCAGESVGVDAIPVEIEENKLFGLFTFHCFVFLFH